VSEQNGDGTIEQTAPILPWEIAIRQAGWFFQRQPGGGMALKFIPVTPDGQGGMALMPPAVEVAFSAEGWKVFQEEVAAGEKKPQIQTAVALPTPINRAERRKR
jgi:hypothetical protein